MLKVKFEWLLLCIMLLGLGACGSSPASNNNSGASAAEAQAAAFSALGRLDQGGRTDSSSSTPSAQQPSSGQSASSSSSQQQSSSSSTQQTTVNNSRTRPAWIDSVDSVYSRSQYVAAVGQASNRDMAEKNAIANLAGFFGQSIQADQTITNTYQEAVRNGVTAGWTDNIAMQNTIKTSASIDTLVGAEIREVWFDSRNTYYAVAVMEKTKTAQLYTDMINANQNMIHNLITMRDSEKNTLEGYSRYRFAATVADINITYGNILKLIDAPVPAGLVKGDTYRLEAQNITKSIPVGIVVKNDKAGRIQGAFAKALADIGFRTGGNNSRYVLNVDITVSPVDLQGNTNKFARIELTANLTDSTIKAVLVPYNFNSREGHTTVSEAENRAYMAAERKINEEYKNLLSDYLNQLLPKK